jgi:hypothetical protein
MNRSDAGQKAASSSRVSSPLQQLLSVLVPIEHHFAPLLVSSDSRISDRSLIMRGTASYSERSQQTFSKPECRSSDLFGAPSRVFVQEARDQRLKGLERRMGEPARPAARVRRYAAPAALGGPGRLARPEPSTRQQHLLVDVAVHFVKARGAAAPKVFKLGRIVLGPLERVDLKTAFSLAVHTTRVPRPGRHPVDVIVNGRVIRAGSFDVSHKDR